MRRVLAPFLVLIALVGLVGCGLSMDRAEAVSSMNKGLEALNSGSSLDAVRHLKEAGQIDPTYADPPYYLGQVYHRKLSELDNAELWYREALSRDDENPQIAYQLGTVLTDQEKWAESISYFQKAVELKPDFGKAWFRKGLSHEMEKAYPDAVESYMKAINVNARMKMDPADKGGAAYHALGDLYNRFGFYDKAFKVYENALENNGDVPRLLMGRGVAQLKLKRFPDAASSFEKALSIDPSQTTAIFNLAVAHMAMKETEKAVTGFETFTGRADRTLDEARIVAAEGFVAQIKAEEEAAEEKEK